MKKLFKKASVLTVIALIFCLAGCASEASGEPKTTNSTSTPPPEKNGLIADSTVSEQILSICDNASISVSDNSLSVDLSGCYDTSSKEYVQNLLHDCALIIGTSNFSEHYSSLSFTYNDDNFLSTLSITGFNDVSDYYSTSFCTPVDGGDANYSASYSILYNKLFYNHDTENKQLIEQGKIAEEYNVNGGDATAKPQPEDELWFYSFFDDSVLFSFEDSLLAANYRYDTDDYFQYGYDVYSDLSRATKMFETYFSNSPELITADRLLFICFDGQSDSRLCEFIYDREKNDTFTLSVNYLNDDFKEGVLSKYKETK